MGAIGFLQVEQDVFRRRLVTGRHHVEPLDGIGLVAGAKFVKPFRCFGKLGEELGSDFRADFVAAAADGWTNGGKKFGRLGFEVHLHLADGFGHDTGQRATPAGVDGADSALFGVYEENGDAVGGLDAQKEAGTVGNGGIAAARFGGRGVEKMDDVGVDLL